MSYVIKNIYRIRPTDLKEFECFFHYSLTGNHFDGGNVWGELRSAKRFESEVKAKRMAREFKKMRPRDKYLVVDLETLNPAS